MKVEADIREEFGQKSTLLRYVCEVCDKKGVWLREGHESRSRQLMLEHESECRAKMKERGPR